MGRAPDTLSSDRSQPGDLRGPRSARGTTWGFPTQPRLPLVLAASAHCGEPSARAERPRPLNLTFPEVRGRQQVPQSRSTLEAATNSRTGGGGDARSVGEQPPVGCRWRPRDRPRPIRSYSGWFQKGRKLLPASAAAECTFLLAKGIPRPYLPGVAASRSRTLLILGIERPRTPETLRPEAPRTPWCPAPRVPNPSPESRQRPPDPAENAALVRSIGAMAAPDLSTNLQEEATCAICLDYFTDPVMTDCGHNFCRECIRRCWGQPEGPYACPECRELFPQRNLRPNRPLAKMAEMARRLHPPSPVPQGVCAAHREPLAAFCGDELRLLCAACERSGEHWAHRVRPLQDAAEDLKVWAGPGQSTAW